jgi:arginyl-tRNA synthetase
MVFNPSESIDLHGYTATFIQYAYARIRSVLRKEAAQSAGIPPIQATAIDTPLLPLEKKLVINLEKYPAVLAQAVAEMSPSVVAAYAFEVAKAFNSFYSEHSIANAESSEKKVLRMQICRLTVTVLQSALGLLGIRMPERM